jgi:hypothetical protein
MFFGTSYWKRQFQRPKCRLEDNKISLKAVICNGGNWIYVNQDRVQILAVVYTARDLKVP